MCRLITVVGALALIPDLAMAQPPNPYCVASNQGSQAEGTILGGIGGALIGGALGNGAGALIGGLTGAVAGDAIAGARNTPCPAGYAYAPPPGYVGYGPPPPPPPEAGSFWGGAPGDVRQRIDWMQDRVSNALNQGLVTPDQAQNAYAELRKVRDSANNLAVRDGGLTASDRDYLQARLNYIGHHLHWMERADAGAGY